LNGINIILEEQVLRAKESPYAKRWWIKGLSALRSRFTNKRNRVISLRRRGEDTTQVREQAHQARSIYLSEVEKQKKQH
jgi:hypothetical protein